MRRVALVTVPEAGCCGAVDFHLGAHDAGRDRFRRNIDAWWPEIQAGAEAIVISASGCGAMVKEYGELLADDPDYAEKAQRVATLARDLSEILLGEDLSALDLRTGEAGKVAVHCPCTLQHAMQLPTAVDEVLRCLGFSLAETRNRHLCCGSAGTYSLLQPEISRRLLGNKLADLTVEKPAQIATANIGCQLHLASESAIPVRHWIELVAEALAKQRPEPAKRTKEKP